MGQEALGPGGAKLEMPERAGRHATDVQHPRRELRIQRAIAYWRSNERDVASLEMQLLRTQCEGAGGEHEDDW